MPIDAFEPHPLVRLLGMPSAEFTANALVRAVEELGLEQVNLRYVGGDGRLKTLAFPINSRQHLHEVLTRGERVDGSSVFPGTDTDASDVYIVPRHRTAFLNPFGERTSLDVLCSFYREDGTPLPYAREQVVRRAAEVLTLQTGMTLEAFGELEYYLAADPEPIYPVESERGYQESAPFSKHERVREQVLGHLREMGVAMKYVHGEVGNILEDDRQLVQHEIELQPVPLEQAADAIVLTKWVVREVAYAHGLEATFAPLVSGDGAGNGLHIHSRLVRDGTNVIVDDAGITDTARRLIAGYLSAARALSAFGNTVPTSYLRFAEGEESPEDICWGMQDRTGLVRVPLAWGGDVLADMVAHANPGSSEPIPEPAVHPQTVEFRLADGSADVHLLLAGMAVAARRGLDDPGSLEQAERLNAADGEDFETLPTSCAESADVLEAEREMFEADGVFPAALIDSVLAGLRGDGDEDDDDNDDDDDEVGDSGNGDADREELIRRHWHVG
ncbi:glutamine synthetase [Dietzia sp. DQ11-71]|nr:glutamine synthetase family protein [Dietzia sp. DQ11-71]MBB1016995.1 glutamine synthetase [Dietzia sp. DQ11-71]